MKINGVSKILTTRIIARYTKDNLPPENHPRKKHILEMLERIKPKPAGPNLYISMCCGCLEVLKDPIENSQDSPQKQSNRNDEFSFEKHLNYIKGNNQSINGHDR